MKYKYIILLLLFSALLTGCSIGSSLSSKGGFQSKTHWRGDLLCLTMDDLDETKEAVKRCVYLDKCESGYYEQKCRDVKELNDSWGIDGDCRGLRDSWT